MAESPLDPRILIRAPLRCDGIGRLDCAEDVESGGRLAVRWLPLEANGEAAVKACAKLPEHPMLPRIRQTGHVGGSAFVAMEFPEGVLLSTLAGERLEVDRVIRLGAQLSDALATVHAQGVVHGELSTDSVLLVEPDCAYLWDMPLVIANRLTDRRGENRLMQNLVKTAPFLAPERARGEGASQASDVYALGAVLCVAAGAPLPVAATTLGVVYQIATGAYSPRVPTVLPVPYRSMLARMVAADPAKRPTAAEVAEVFAELPAPAALPTVPEFPVVKLPPELLAAADALLRRPSLETPAVPAGPGRSRENAVPDDEAVGTADAVKRRAVARSEATGPTKASAPLAPAAVDPAVREGDALASGATAQAAVDAAPGPVKTGTSGPALEPVAATPASVQLTDTISVSPELAQAGAVTLSAEEIEALQRSRRQVLLVAGGLGGAILALLLVAFTLATSHAEPVVVPAPRPAMVEPATPAPEQAEAEADDGLAPLPSIPQRTGGRPAKAEPARVEAPLKPTPARAQTSKPAPARAAEAAEAKAGPTPVEHVEPSTPPTASSDFEFLDSSAEAPTSELKRPSW